MAVVSHELRGAAGAIGAAVQVLQGSEGAPAVAAEAREVIQRQSQRLATVLDDAQQLARLLAPGEPGNQEPVDLAALLESCDVKVAGAAPVAIRGDAALLHEAMARTVREAPSRPHASFEAAKDEAATLFTLEPVGGGFGVQFLRALLERSGAQACVTQGAQGRRLVARFAR